MKMTEVVAALIWDADKFLICRRPANKARALLWEFAGGKVEPHETKQQALIRECREELAVSLRVGEVFMEVVHEYPDLTIRLTVFAAEIAAGTPQKLEHEDLRWITADEIPQYSFCPADEQILARLRADAAQHETERKLQVLSEIAHLLNEKQILWAVGASLLLYFKGKCSEFHDLDLMVAEQDGEKAKQALETLGKLLPPNPNAQYKTRLFLEFNIRGVEVDVISGFAIVKDGVQYDCSLRAEQIAQTICVNGEKIPLQALSDWHRYYTLMGRAAKARLCEQ